MDPLQASQFATELSQYYQDRANQIEDLLEGDAVTMSLAQEKELSTQFHQLLDYSNQFAALSDTIAFEGADAYFQKVLDANEQITEALKTIQTVDKVINITAGVIGLAESLLIESPEGVVGSLETIAQSIKA